METKLEASSWLVEFSHREKHLGFWTNSKRYSKFLAKVFLYCNTYSKLNTYQSAISLISSTNVGTDETIQRFCKGAASQKPQAPKYDTTWDPKIVLSYLSSQDPNDALSLEHLFKKLLTLLAVSMFVF